MLRTLLACLLLVLGVAPQSAEQATTSRPIDEAESVFAVYLENAGGGPGDPKEWPALVLAVWADGHVVWSEDHLNGGPPYRASDIDPARFVALLSAFERDGLFELKDTLHFGPDSVSTVVLVKSGARTTRLQSWHEQPEVGGKIVGLQGGLFGLDGRRRLDVLREASAEWLFFRFVWSETRQRLAALVPCGGTPVSGRATMHAGEVTWLEEAMSAPTDNSAPR